MTVTSFKIIQDDVNCIINGFTNFKSANLSKTQGDKKVQKAALRLLGISGMAYAAVKGLTTLTICSGGGVVPLLGATALIYVLSHDLFIYRKNLTKNETHISCSLFNGLASNDVDEYEEGGNGCNPQGYLNLEGTFFRPVWDVVNIANLIRQVIIEYNWKDLIERLSD